jgi:hypothetical protein
MCLNVLVLIHDSRSSREQTFIENDSMPNDGENRFWSALRVILLPPNGRHRVEGCDNNIVLAKKINTLPVLTVENVQFEGIWTDVSGNYLLEFSDITPGSDVKFQTELERHVAFVINGRTYKLNCFSHACITARTLISSKGTELVYSQGGGTINNVVLIFGSVFGLGSGVIGGDGKTVFLGCVATRQIMLRVLPNPMSSARRPPWKFGGGCSWEAPVTLFTKLEGSAFIADTHQEKDEHICPES